MLIYTIKGDLCNHETNKEVSIEEVESLQKVAIDTFYETFGPYYTDDNLQKYFDSAFNIETLKRNYKNHSHFIIFYWRWRHCWVYKI